MKKTLAIDFDGVIHDIKHPVPGRRMGPPMKGAKEALDEYASMGHEIVIFTVRANTASSTKAVRDWMQYYLIPFDYITNIKINADVFIDDKAVHFTSWNKIKI